MEVKMFFQCLLCMMLIGFIDEARAGYVFERELKYDAVASSELKSPKYSYSTLNLKDENPDNAWCEGKKGDGTGQWLQLDLQDKKGDLSGELIVNLLPGYAKSLELFKANARPSKVRIIITEKSTGNIMVDTKGTLPSINDAIEMQTYSLHLGQKVSIGALRLKIVVDRAYKGAKYDDLCISELQVFDKTALDKGLDSDEEEGQDNIENREFERLLPVAEKGNTVAIQGLIRMADGEYYRGAEGGEFLAEIYLELFYKFPERFLFLLSKQSKSIRAKVEDDIITPINDKYSEQEIADKVRAVKGPNVTEEYKSSIVNRIMKIHGVK